MADIWPNSMACHPTSQNHLPHCRVLPLGEFSGMSSQSHISHCRVLPLGEFTVMIGEPHATLQGAVTWRNHDRATLQGVIIPSNILKTVFRHISFFWAVTSGGFRIVSDTVVISYFGFRFTIAYN